MPATDLFERIGQGAKTVLDGLGMTHADGIKALSIYAQTVAGSSTIDFPCALVLWQDGTEEEGEGDFEDQDVTYPIYVLFADRQPSEDQKWRSYFLGLRKQGMDGFRQLVTLPDCPEVYDVRLRPMTAIRSDMVRSPEYMYVASGFIVRAFTREAYAEHP